MFGESHPAQRMTWANDPLKSETSYVYNNPVFMFNVCFSQFPLDLLAFHLRVLARCLLKGNISLEHVLLQNNHHQPRRRVLKRVPKVRTNKYRFISG